MQNKKLITVIMVWLYVLFPLSLDAENPEWMYFHELEDVRGLEAIGDYIYIGLAWPGLGTRRLSLETLELDTIDPTVTAYSFAEDSKGAVWIGTWMWGLWKYKDNSIVNKYDHTNSNLKQFWNGPNLLIHAITIDKYDNKWLATDTGLVRFDGVEAKYFAHGNPRTGAMLVYRNLLLDPDGESLWLWDVGRRPGIMQFSQEQFIIYDTSNTGIGTSSIQGLDIDKQDNLWMSGFHFPSLPNSGKLVKFDGANWEHYDMEPSIKQLSTTVVRIDNDDTKWLATRWGGLIKYDGSEWKQFNKSNSGISNNRILDIKIDKYGNKWIVPAESGIWQEFPSLEVFREGGILLPTNVQELIREHDAKMPLVYPNPAQDIIRVTDLIKRERAYSISNIYGQVLMEGSFFHEINISSLPAGFYFLKVNNKFLKFIKLK